jgi:UDP-N-acetylglucosamine 4,6-dehydratase
MTKFLITGGTGSVGRALAHHLLGDDSTERVVIYSRDEQKQEELSRELEPVDRKNIVRYMLGDVRDIVRLASAMRGIGTVIHTAALKIVPKCEYDPIEAVKTNIYGTENVIQAAIGAGIARAIMLSTDKAVSPINLYGATKLAAERIFIAANHLSGSPGNPHATRFSIVRYGNAARSRGSVIPLFKRLRAAGEPLPITHPEMTRFWITIEDAVKFVVRCLEDMRGGEVFIPRMPSFRVVDLAEAIAGKEPLRFIGMRPGEKIHETLITPHDSPFLVDDLGRDRFVIMPEWASILRREITNFTYSSDTNTDWLSVDKLRKLTMSAEESNRRFIITDGH